MSETRMIPKYKDEEKDPKYIIDTVFNDLSVGAYIRLGGGCGGMINDFFPGRRLNVPGNSAEMFRERIEIRIFRGKVCSIVGVTQLLG